jgi:hypothetical protein
MIHYTVSQESTVYLKKKIEDLRAFSLGGVFSATRPSVDPVWKVCTVGRYSPVRDFPFCVINYVPGPVVT